MARTDEFACRRLLQRRGRVAGWRPLVALLVVLMMLGSVLSSLTPSRPRGGLPSGMLRERDPDEPLVFDLADLAPSDPSDPPDPPDRSDPATHSIGRAIDAARRGAGLEPLQDDPRLVAAAQRGAAAMARAIARNPASPGTPDEPDLDALRQTLPEAAQLMAEIVAANELPLLESKASRGAAGSRPELTHRGVGVSQAALDNGQTFWVAVLLGARLLPEISPQAVTTGKGEAYVRCFHCQATMLVRLEVRQDSQAGGVRIVCAQCDRVCDLFAANTVGDYHRPPWFLRGFQPRQIDNPLTAWLTVLTHCRYVEDLRQYGRADVWQTAEQTYRLRQGDCEDTAILLADWLTAAGYKTRVVLGNHAGGGHAWVVVSAGGRSYVLETTGGRGNYRRVPPRAALSTDYVPEAQFDRTGIWFRTSPGWTAEYDDASQWKRGPWVGGTTGEGE